MNDTLLSEINNNLQVLIVCVGIVIGCLLAHAFNFWKW